MKIHPILAARPGKRFETRVVRSRLLTPTTHGIEVEKPLGFTFQPTQFTFLQVQTPDDVAVHPDVTRDEPDAVASRIRRPRIEFGLQAYIRRVTARRFCRHSRTPGSLHPR